MNTKTRDSERAALVKKTSRITGVSERQVNRILETVHKNPLVVSVFMELKEGTETLENNLLTAVKLAVPFN